MIVNYAAKYSQDANQNTDKILWNKFKRKTLKMFYMQSYNMHTNQIKMSTHFL